MLTLSNSDQTVTLRFTEIASAHDNSSDLAALFFSFDDSPFVLGNASLAPNAGNPTAVGSALGIVFVIDTDKDGLSDNVDSDDDIGGILDIVEVNRAARHLDPNDIAETAVEPADEPEELPFVDHDSWFGKNIIPSEEILYPYGRFVRLRSVGLETQVQHRSSRRMSSWSMKQTGNGSLG